MNALSRDCSAISLRDAEAARALWCAVLMEQWVLATDPNPSDDEEEVIKARRWFGSKWFYRVCALAGVEAEAILSACRDRGMDVSRPVAFGVSPVGLPVRDGPVDPLPRPKVRPFDAYPEGELCKRMKSLAVREGNGPRRVPGAGAQARARAVDLVMSDLIVAGPSPAAQICQRLPQLMPRQVYTAIKNLNGAGRIRVVRRFGNNKVVWGAV